MSLLSATICRRRSVVGGGGTQVDLPPAATIVYSAAGLSAAAK